MGKEETDGNTGTSTREMEVISNLRYSFGGQGHQRGVEATFIRLQAWESLAKPSAHGVLVGAAGGISRRRALAWNRRAGSQ